MDIHDRTAERVFGTNSGLDAHELRRRAKIINYALLYGKTAFTLAKDIGVPQTAAQAFIDAYFAGFPRRARVHRPDTRRRARESGVVRTITGRRRLVPELHEQERPGPRGGRARDRQHADPGHGRRHPQEGDDRRRARRSSDRNRTRPAPSRMILTVHDELLFEAPAGEAGAVAEAVRDVMERAMTLAVPLTVDVGIGQNWKEAKP